MAGVMAKYTLMLVPMVPFMAASMLSVSPALAIEPVKFSGEVSGLVTDGSGKPTPGASILLFNKQDHLLQRIQADAQGNFTFVDLIPDLYSIRVSLSNYLPAIKNRVQVRPGMRSLLEVSLSRLYSTIQIVSTTPSAGGLMSDNWKWALRTDTARRPILRILPAAKPERSEEEKRSSLFSDSRGLIRVSASEGAQSLGSANQADLGTQFAFATSVYGANRVQLSGNIGFTPATGAPLAGIRTTYSREFAGTSPEVSVTLRQLASPLRTGMNMAGAMPLGLVTDSSYLRTLAVSFADHTQITDSLDLQYGFEMDMVSFVSRMHYFSPYSKLVYSIPHGTVDFTWTSGNARPELGANGTDPNSDLQRELTSLAMIPKFSVMDGNAKIQRGEDYEFGVSQRYGSREYRLSAYREVVTNAALALSATGRGELFSGDLLQDLFSNSLVFNAGRFESTGYTASILQDLSDNYKVSLAYGSAGVLLPRQDMIPGNSARDLRSILVARDRPAVTLRAMGTVKETGTKFSTSYQWADSRSATPAQMYSTQPLRPEPGFNVYVRQPIPVIPGLPWRMEATMDFRNLLAQGYLTLNMPDGQQLVLVPNPRSFRGGLAFVF